MTGREVERRIQELARTQHGVVTRAQLAASGVGDGALRSHERAGWLRRLHHGVYQVGPIAAPWAREMAAVLAYRPGSYISHGSALSLRGLVPPAGPGDSIEVLVVGRRVRERAGIRARHVARLADDETATVDGIPTTALGRTLVDFAAGARPRDAEGAIARAERERLVTPDELSRLPRRYSGVPGIRKLRAILEAVGGPALTRSEAEALFLEMVRIEKLPIPEVNARVAGCELDFYWPRERFAAEVDGYRWHASRPSFERDRRRSVHLAATGIQVVRLTWRQIVDDAKETAGQLRRALALARSRRR